MRDRNRDLEFDKSDPDSRLMSLSEIAKRLPPVRGDKPPNRSTLYKWARYGLISRSGRKIYLATEFVGGTLCTTMDDVHRLGRQKDDVEPVPDEPPVTARELARRRERADAAIARMRASGFLK